MARNRKITNTKTAKKIQGKINARLDPITLQIWNKMKVSRNMSKWLRDQLLWHFGGQLSENQIKLAMREEVAILNRSRAEKIEDIDSEVNGQIARTVEVYQKILSTREEDKEIELFEEGPE